MMKWVIWSLIIVASFAAIEGYSLMHGTDTLSRTIWKISAAWPPFPFLAGFMVGFLACHFWWGGIIGFRPVKKGKNDG